MGGTPNATRALDCLKGITPECGTKFWTDWDEGSKVWFIFGGIMLSLCFLACCCLLFNRGSSSDNKYKKLADESGSSKGGDKKTLDLTQLTKRAEALGQELEMLNLQERVAGLEQQLAQKKAALPLIGAEGKAEVEVDVDGNQVTGSAKSAMVPPPSLST